MSNRVTTKKLSIPELDFLWREPAFVGLLKEYHRIQAADEKTGTYHSQRHDWLEKQEATAKMLRIE